MGVPGEKACFSYSVAGAGYATRGARSTGLGSKMTDHPGIAPKGEAETFEEHILRVNPTAAALENLSVQPDDDPIIMLNLLRFKPRGDSSIYSLYARDAAPEVAKTGSFVGFYGKVLSDLDPSLGIDVGWDSVALVVYKRRRSFLQMQQSPIYQSAVAYRVAGAYARLLYVTKDGANFFEAKETVAGLDNNREPLAIGKGEIAVIDLFGNSSQDASSALKHFAGQRAHLLEGVGAETLLSLETEVPIVSEDYWQHCCLTRFPSLEALIAFLASPDGGDLSQSINAGPGKHISLATESVAIPV